MLEKYFTPTPEENARAEQFFAIDIDPAAPDADRAVVLVGGGAGGGKSHAPHFWYVLSQADAMPRTGEPDRRFEIVPEAKPKPKRQGPTKGRKWWDR